MGKREQEIIQHEVRRNGKLAAWFAAATVAFGSVSGGLAFKATDFHTTQTTIVDSPNGSFHSVSRTTVQPEGQALYVASGVVGLFALGFGIAAGRRTYRAWRCSQGDINYRQFPGPML